MSASVHGFQGSGVIGSISSLNWPWVSIYEKSVSFVSPNPKFGAKLVIIWENEHFEGALRVFNALLCS